MRISAEFGLSDKSFIKSEETPSNPEIYVVPIGVLFGVPLPEIQVS